MSAMNIGSKYHWGHARVVGTALYCVLCEGRMFYHTLSLLLDELADVPDMLAVDIYKSLDEAMKPNLLPNEIVGDGHPVAQDKGLASRFLSLKSLIGRGNFAEKRTLVEEVSEPQSMQKERYWRLVQNA